jgi:uncharacterized protein YjbI with pentapeptide repeats
MRKATYLHEKVYREIRYQRDEINFNEFESCVFERCDFSQSNFIDVTFIDCKFLGCNFNGAKINHVAFRGVFFSDCQMKDVNFAMCDKLIFEISFKDCILDFSKFYTLKLKATTFTDCSLIAVDFMEADLTNVLFDHCDLYRTLFMKSILDKADFTTSFNYTLDPSKNKIQKAMFSREGVKGLLSKHEIIVVDI